MSFQPVLLRERVPTPPMRPPYVNWKALHQQLERTRYDTRYAWTRIHKNAPTRPTRSYVASKLGLELDEVQVFSRRTAPQALTIFPSSKSLSTQSGRKRSGAKTASGKILRGVGWEVYVRLTPRAGELLPHQRANLQDIETKRAWKAKLASDDARQLARRFERWTLGEDGWAKKIAEEERDEEIRSMSLTQQRIARDRVHRAKLAEWLAHRREAEAYNREFDRLRDWDAAIEWENKRQQAAEGILRAKKIAGTVGANRTRPGGVDYAPPTESEETK